MIITQYDLYKDCSILANNILENKNASVLKIKTLKHVINYIINNYIKNKNARKDCSKICNFECVYDSSAFLKGTYKKPFSIKFIDDRFNYQLLSECSSRELAGYLNEVIELYKNELDNKEKNAIIDIINIFDTIGRLVDFIYFIK